MYLGTTKKRNGSYSPTFAKSPKKTWAYWLQLSEVEARAINDLQSAIKASRNMPNLPSELEALAEVNQIKSAIERSRDISQAVKDAAFELI